MAFSGSIINYSPTKIFPTAASLTGAAFTAVSLGENGFTAASASSIPFGIITAEHELPIAAGEDVTAQVEGGTLWQVGEAVKAGDLLSAGDGGKAVKATSGKFIFAQATENGAANSAVHVQIIKAGYAN